jgi:NTP pyrophosphatase (non-canonical NTP hydrolase)
MASEQELEDAIEELNEAVADVADDTARWSQAESLEIFEGVASAAKMRAQTIRQEMEDG